MDQTLQPQHRASAWNAPRMIRPLPPAEPEPASSLLRPRGRDPAPATWRTREQAELDSAVQARPLSCKLVRIYGIEPLRQDYRR
jgi:hypothetical protein